MTLTTLVQLNEMDGRRLYYTFVAGARKVIEHQIELNKINVFPVNDGDTGTNLASTIRAVIDSLHPHRSYKITADRIAEITLINARGNSGIFHNLWGVHRILLCAYSTRECSVLVVRPEAKYQFR